MDVGGGVGKIRALGTLQFSHVLTLAGGMSLELAKRFPSLNFVLQDRASVVEKAKVVWAREVPGVVASGRIKFMAHDFFTEQPIKRAEVYLMRHIL